MRYFCKTYISALLVIFLTITGMSNVAGATNNTTHEVKASNATSVEKSVYSINANISPEISAKAKELKKTVKREAKEFQTENSRHYELSDGSYVAEIHGESQYYKDSNNTWKEIDTRLTDEADLDSITVPITNEAYSDVQAIVEKNNYNRKLNKIDKSRTNFRPLHVPYNAIIPKDYSNGYSVAKGNDRITLIPLHAQSVAGSIYSSSSILYKEVWKETDVILTVQNSSLKEDIILQSEKAPNNLSFEVQGHLTDELKAGELSISPAWLVDSKGLIREVEQTVRTENEKLYIDLNINSTGLTYPIKVDPTIMTNTPVIQAFCGAQSVDPGFMSLSPGPGPCTFDLRYTFLATTSVSKVQSATLKLVPHSVYSSNSNHIVKVRSFITSYAIVPQDVGIYSVNPADNSFNIDVTAKVKQYIGYTTNSYPIDLVFQFSSESNNLTGSYITFYGNPKPVLLLAYNVYAPGTAAITAPQSGTVVDANYNITWNAAIDQDDPQSSLKYNIQLSTNGGSTWSDIVPLTAAGASSYTYNFSSIANTTNAIIRIRSFDGIDYGSWLQSPTFTIKHNSVPNAPTALNPGSASSTTPQLMGTTTPALNWTFSDPDVGDTQGQYQVLIYNGSTLIRDSGWVSSAVASYTVPTGTFSRNGNYSWQVRTKDNKGAISALSTLYYIKINNLPIVNVTSYTNGQQVSE